MWQHTGQVFDGYWWYFTSLPPPAGHFSKFNPASDWYLLIPAVYKGNHINITLGVIFINPMLPNLFQRGEVVKGGGWGKKGVRGKN